MLLAPGVDDQGAGTAPVLAPDGGADAVDIGGGSERVKITQRKLFRVRAAISLSSTTTIRGKAFTGRPRKRRRQKASMARRPPSSATVQGGPWTTRTPGSEVAAGKSPSAGARPRDLRGQFPPLRPGGGNHHLGALVETVAGIVEGVDGGAGLEMQVAPPVDPLQHMLEEGRTSCRSRPGRLHGRR